MKGSAEVSDDREFEEEIHHTKQKIKWGCFASIAMLFLGAITLLGIMVGSSYLFTLLYFFSLLVVMIIIEYLPLVTLPAIIISLVLKKNIRRSIVSIVVIILIKLLNNFNRNGRGPTEVEYVLWQMREGSIWIYLSLIGYLYLIYWWIIFFKKNKETK